MRRAPRGRYPPATVRTPRTRSSEERARAGAAAAGRRRRRRHCKGGRERASEAGPPSPWFPPLPPSPPRPPAPRESRGAAGGGGGGGGGGSPRGRVRPAPRRRSRRRRRLSRRWTRNSRTWRRGRRRRCWDPGGRSRAEGAQLVSARARGPRRRGRAPPRCGVQGEAGTAGPGAREQWRSRRGRGGSGPPAPRAPPAPLLRAAARPAGPARPSDLSLLAPALLSPRLPLPSDPFGISVSASATPSSLKPLCSQFCASPFPLPPLSNVLRPSWTLQCSWDPPPQ